MNERRSPEYYRELDDQLRALLPALQQTLSTESWRWFEEFVRAGEYGLAAEVAAEGLMDAAEPPAQLCREVLAAADVMGLESEPISKLRARVATSS